MKIVTVFIVTIILFLLVREVDVIREKIPIDNFISLFSESEIQDLPLLKTTEELEKEKFPEELFSITEKEMSELIESLSLQEKLDMYCDVDNVIDGDTISVDCEYNSWDIRYQHIDTPEVRKKVGGRWIEDPECYSKEASQYNKKFVSNREVILINKNFERDVYGRRLAYVYVKNYEGNYLNIIPMMVANGYAKAYEYTGKYIAKTYDSNYKNIKKLESYAKDNNLGLWGECS